MYIYIYNTYTYSFSNRLSKGVSQIDFGLKKVCKVASISTDKSPCLLTSPQRFVYVVSTTLLQQVQWLP